MASLPSYRKEHIHTVKTVANYLPDITLLCIMFKDIEQDKADRIYMLSLSSDSPSIPLEGDSYQACRGDWRQGRCRNEEHHARTSAKVASKHGLLLLMLAVSQPHCSCRLLQLMPSQAAEHCTCLAAGQDHFKMLQALKAGPYASNTGFICLGLRVTHNKERHKDTLSSKPCSHKH